MKKKVKALESFSGFYGSFAKGTEYEVESIVAEEYLCCGYLEEIKAEQKVEQIEEPKEEVSKTPKKVNMNKKNASNPEGK